MVKIAILGCGTIGQGVYDIITDRMNDGVLSVERVLDLRDLTGYIADGIQTRDFADIENDPGISVVVETMGGVKPAYDFVKASLIAGKHVVTSNKALVDACGTELLKIAAEHGVHFFFEASVGGGIPVIRALTDSLGGDKVLKIEGT